MTWCKPEVRTPRCDDEKCPACGPHRPPKKVGNCPEVPSSPFFTAEDGIKWPGSSQTMIPLSHANAKLEGFIVVDAKEWEKVAVSLKDLKEIIQESVNTDDAEWAYEQLKPLLYELESLRRAKEKYDREMLAAVEHVRSLGEELESLRALKAKVDAAPWVYAGIDAEYDNEPQYWSTELCEDCTRRAKLLDPEEIRCDRNPK